MKKKIIFLNYLLNVLILKRKKYIIILKNKNTNVLINVNQLKINKNNKILTIGKMTNDTSIFKKINEYIKGVNNFFIKKLNFNGKGFKIKKVKKICFFLFNKSHKNYIIEGENKILKISKNSFIMTYKNKKNNLNEKIKNIFKINKFTKKGIRTSEEIINIKKK